MALPTVQRLIEEGIEQGLHPGAQLHVRHRGEVIADLAFGEARPGVAMTTKSLLLWLSAGKPLTAIAMARLWEQDKLHFDDPVALHLPAFGQRGKEGVTLRHVLTHTGGFPHVELPQGGDWADAVQAICEAPLAPGMSPGEDAAYHSMTGWYILGEVVQRITGEPFSQHLRQHLFLPLGMDDCWIGLPPEQYDAYGDRMALTFRTTGDEPEPNPLATRDALVEPNPGANAIGPASQLARFYQMLLRGGELDGERLLEPETVELFTIPHREDKFDKVFQYPMVWGLGFIIEPQGRRGRMPYGYGRRARPGVFGHGGMESASGFADPHHDLVVALLFNGQPGEKLHQRRVDAILTALYDELSLA